MKATGSCEMFVVLYQAIRRHIKQDLYYNISRWSRHSVVGKGPGQWIFSSPEHLYRLCAPPTLIFSRYSCPVPGLKRAERDADHLPHLVPMLGMRGVMEDEDCALRSNTTLCVSKGT